MNILSKSPEWNFPSSKDASRPVAGFNNEADIAMDIKNQPLFLPQQWILKMKPCCDQATTPLLDRNGHQK